MTRVAALLIDPDQDGLRDTERLAIRIRNSATLSGRCACGASAPRLPLQRGRMTEAAMCHEADCPAISRCIEQAARRLGPSLALVLAITGAES